MDKNSNRPTFPLATFFTNFRLWAGFLLLVFLYQTQLPSGLRALFIPPLLLCWILLSILFVRSLFFANTIDKTCDNLAEVREGWNDLRKSERVKISINATLVLALVMSILMGALILSQGAFEGLKNNVEQTSPAATE